MPEVKRISILKLTHRVIHSVEDHPTRNVLVFLDASGKVLFQVCRDDIYDKDGNWFDADVDLPLFRDRG